jgi:hypothetical protein
MGAMVMGKKPSAQKMAVELNEIQKIPVCEDCEVLRGANIFAIKYFGKSKASSFEENLSRIMTTHVDLGCKACPVDDVLKSIRKDRFAAVAAML